MLILTKENNKKGTIKKEAKENKKGKKRKENVKKKNCMTYWALKSMQLMHK